MPALTPTQRRILAVVLFAATVVTGKACQPTTQGGTDMSTDPKAAEGTAEATPDEPFGPVIYSYTDAEACEDGVLVPIDQRNRCTRALFEELVRSLPESPPNRWPVDLFGYIAAASNNQPGLRAEAACKGLLARYHMKTEPQGEILQVWVVRPQGATITGLSEAGVPDYAGFEIWIAKNELGGVTAMFPSDY